METSSSSNAAISSSRCRRNARIPSVSELDSCTVENDKPHQIQAKFHIGLRSPLYSQANAPREINSESKCEEPTLRGFSKQNRRQPSTGWLIVEPDAHQRHRLHDMQTIREAPAQQRSIPRGHKNSRTSERFCRGDQRLHVEIRFGCGMAEKSQPGRISSNCTATFYHLRGAFLDGLRKFGAAVKSMHAPRQCVAPVYIARLSCPDRTSGHIAFTWLSLDAGKRLAYIETEV